MEYFLERIAKILYCSYGNHLDSHCLVFPNRRAGLFFLKYLSAEISKPLWAPSILTVNDLFHSLSSLQPAENEILLFELYKQFRKIKKTQESFDDFYFWGDMLLNDFDDIDKYMVDASKLFSNILDIKKIDEQFGDLTPEQVQIIKRFWINLDPKKLTREKSEFISVWSVLNDLYRGFRTSLKEQNIAYEGMIFRDVAENQKLQNAAAVSWDMVHFIGFNALNECEKEIMLRLKKVEKAKFYWDYDNSYMSNTRLNSAGFFLRENIILLGNDMPVDWNYKTNLSSGRDFNRKVIDTSSDIAQAKLLPDLINEIPGLTPGNAHNTAVILADETLLLPVLTSLPETNCDVNITMGYPLKQTAVYLLVKHLLDLQLTCRQINSEVMFSTTEVHKVLKHTLISGIINGPDISISEEILDTSLVWIPASRSSGSVILKEIFRKPGSPAMLSDYLRSVLSLIVSGKTEGEDDSINSTVRINIRNEFIYRVILALNRLDAVASSPDISLNTSTWSGILDRILRLQAVPFSGEPLSGIQIMGILETRALDFKNLIILSVNEGILPAVTTSSSFIPFSLREAFGLPSINHQESIYAYHFYRLLHRAENVTFVFNSNSEGLRSGEMSRFLQQMKYDESIKPEFLNHGFEIRSHSSVKTSVERTEKHAAALISRFTDTSGLRILSPSAINLWLHCRMKFFFRYVNGLNEFEKKSGDIDPRMLGTLLHAAMKNLYKGFTGKLLNGEFFNQLMRNNQHLTTTINQTINEELKREYPVSVSGSELIVRDVLKVYVERILQIDRITAPFTILGLEYPARFLIPGEAAGKGYKLWAGGTIDRIDLKDGQVSIVDYKTGAIADQINSVSDLFEEDRNKESDGWLQTMLYCESYINMIPGTRVRPSVYKIKKIPGEQVDDRLKIKVSKNDETIVDDYITYRQEFLDGLKATVSTIFNKEEPFRMTTDIFNKCRNCPYHGLCLR